MPAKVFVIMEGGVCQGVCTNDPALAGAAYTVIDYDTDGADESEITRVEQGDGSEADAIIHSGTIDTLTVKRAWRGQLFPIT